MLSLHSHNSGQKSFQDNIRIWILYLNIVIAMALTLTLTLIIHLLNTRLSAYVKLAGDTVLD